MTSLRCKNEGVQSNLPMPSCSFTVVWTESAAKKTELLFFEDCFIVIETLPPAPILESPQLNHSKNHYDPTKPSSGRAGSHARPTAGHCPAGHHPGEHFLFGSFSASQMRGEANLDAKLAVEVFVYGKFFLIFSFLFGYSANFIVGDGAPWRKRVQRRRLTVLALLGFLHGQFLFAWDILLGYAVLGFVLLWLMRFSSAALVRLAVIFAVVFNITAALLDGLVDARKSARMLAGMSCWVGDAEA